MNQFKVRIKSKIKGWIIGRMIAFQDGVAWGAGVIIGIKIYIWLSGGAKP